MPGLQSIISSWTKINHQNVEYISERDGGLHPRPPGGAPSPSASGLSPSGPTAHQAQAGGGVGGGPGAFLLGGGAVDPRAASHANANTPQPSFPSSSSLSSFSFAKNGGLATADTTSLTATPPIGAAREMAAASALAAHDLQRRGSVGIGGVGRAAANANVVPPPSRRELHDASPSLMVLTARGSSTVAPSSSRSSSSSSRGGGGVGIGSGIGGNLRRSHHRNGSGNLHGQLESYGRADQRPNGDANNMRSFPAPPQAGADAILGRRKVGAGGPSPVYRTSDSSLLSAVGVDVPALGEPPASLIESGSSPPYALSSSVATSKASGNRPPSSSLERSPSSSLWHSTRSISSGTSSSNNNASGGGGGAESVTASLDKMNATFRNINAGGLQGGGGNNLIGPSLATTAASIAELNATAENALRSMNSLALDAAPPTTTTPLQQNPNAQNLNHPRFNPTAVPAPTSRGSSRRFSRQKLSKSHSRSDLAREMAFDRHNTRTKRGGANTSSSSAGSAQAPRSSTVDELDVSRGSTSSQHMLLQQQQQQQQPPQLQHQQPQQQQQQQQQQMGGSQQDQQQLGGLHHNQPPQSQLLQQQLLNPQQRPMHRVPSFLSDPTEDNGWGRMKTNNSSIGRLHNGLNDSLIRNGPPGDHWMQDWFPNHPMPTNSRQSSSGSSGTAVTGNTRSMGKIGGSESISDATFKEKQLPPTMEATTNNNNAASALPHTLPSKQPLGTNNTNCDRCAQMETALLSLQADLEYLRTLDLQSEFTCKECDNASVHHSVRLDPSLPRIKQKTAYPGLSSQLTDVSVGSVGSERGSRASNSRMRRRRSDNNSIGTTRPRSQATSTKFATRTATFLRDASKRLADLSTRHKRQVKQTTHERAYWQNDMHLKLEKFAMMCKNLNEEAAHRSNEVKETKALLDKMTNERNTLVSQVDTLKARVELYEDENVEQSRLRQEWSQEKSSILDSVESAVKDRDVATSDLSARLELAVETIRNERKLHNQRRQIIFPKLERRDTIDSNGSGAPNSPHYRQSMSLEFPTEDFERIQRTKEAAEKAQISLEEAMLLSSEREKAMQSRLNAMERELDEARAAVDGGSERRDASFLEPLSIRCINSSASLSSAG